MNSRCNVEFEDENGYYWKNKSVDINFSFELEVRSYGIKNISFALSKIGIGKEYGKGWETFECLDKEEDEEKEIEINLEDYEIKEDWQPAEHYGIKEIEIDEKKKEITVNLFYLSKGSDF